jgi:maltose alpha-D-glucosyltransferase/alpha-amylase
LPYLLTLGPHGFYWFSLERSPQREPVPDVWPQLEVAGSWTEVCTGPTSRAALERILPDYLKGRRWFGGRSRGVRTATLRDVIPVPARHPSALFTLVTVEYREGDPETYALPLAFATGDEAERLRRDAPHAIVGQLRVVGPTRAQEGWLVDALWHRGVIHALFDAITRRKRFRGGQGTIAGWSARPARRRRAGQPAAPLEPRIADTDQSNTSVMLGDRLVLKLLRKVDEGINPDLAIHRFLDRGRAGFTHLAPLAGALEYHRGGGPPSTLALLNRYVPNEADGWRYASDQVAGCFERVLALPPAERQEDPPAGPLVQLADREPPPRVAATIGAFLESARLIGRRTGEMHLALAADATNPDFAPESFSALYQRSLYQSMRNHTRHAFQALRRSLRTLPDPVRDAAGRLLEREAEVLERLAAIRSRRITARRIRIHGDYHLGQLLHLGKDFIVIDFEGDALRPVSERTVKRSALRDVAGMLRSLAHVSLTVLRDQVASGVARPEDAASLRRWAALWSSWSGAAFLDGYFRTAQGGGFLPPDRAELALLLDVYLLERDLIALGHSLSHRPDRVGIAVTGLLHQLGLPYDLA